MGILNNKNSSMNSINEIEDYIDVNQLKHIKVEYFKNEYSVSLVDSTGYEIVKGYGSTVIESINNLHSCLV